MRKLILLFFCFSTLLLSAQQYDQTQKITAWHRQNTAIFGDYVEVWGDHLFVGSPHDAKDISGSGNTFSAGAVYVFKKDSLGNWKEHQKIIASDRDASDYFGISISVYNNTLVIGAPGDEHNSSGGSQKDQAGSAYIYKRNASDKWVQVQKISASRRYVRDRFGSSISLFDSVIAVGAAKHSYDSLGTNYVEDAGAVFIFQEDSTGKFVETQILNDVKRDTSEEFGFYLSLWGSTLAVSAIWDSYDENDTNYIPSDGAVLVYDQMPGGQFQFKQKLVSKNRSVQGLFGQDIQVKFNTMFIGASREKVDTSGLNSLNLAGSAYVYNKVGGVWTFGQHLVNSDRDSSNLFGFSLASFSNKLAIGAINQGTDTAGANFKWAAGAVYYFERNQFGKYIEKQKLVTADRDDVDLFGYNLAIDQYSIFAGSLFEDHDSTGLNQVLDAGSAYIFSTCKSARSYFDTLEICEGDSIMLAGKYRKESGVYVDSFSNKLGCDSNYYHYLNVQSYDPKIVLLMGTLYTNIQGQFYQWIDCDSGNDIVGETGSSFQPPSNGKYAVRVIADSCTFVSDCFDFTTYSIAEFSGHELARIYPNPSANGIFNLELSTELKAAKLVVRDLRGSEILNDVIRGNEYQIDLKSQSSGIYFCTVAVGTTIHQFKLIIR